MTSHTGHSHPATRAARALCRKMDLADPGAPLEAICTCAAAYLGHTAHTQGCALDNTPGHHRIMVQPVIEMHVPYATQRDARTKHRFQVTTLGGGYPSAYAARVTGAMGDWFSSESIALHRDGTAATANRARVRTDDEGRVIYTHPHPYR